MTTATDPPPMDRPDVQRKARRRRPQFALSTFLLLIAALASWAAHWQAIQHTGSLRRQVHALQQIARELRVSDPAQFAAVHRLPQWCDEHIWDVYLPPGNAYELCLALENIERVPVSTTSVPKPARVVTLEPGRHAVELKDDATDQGWSFTVLVDGEVVIEETRPPSWNSSRSSSQRRKISSSEQQSTDQPLELFHRRFFVDTGNGSSTSTSGPSKGVQLWIRSLNRS